MFQNKLIIFRLASFFILTNLQFSHAVNPELLDNFGNEGMGSQGVLIDSRWFLTANFHDYNTFSSTVRSVSLGGDVYDILDIKEMSSAPYAALIYLDRPVLNVDPIARIRLPEGFQFSKDETYYITTLDPLMHYQTMDLNQPEHEEGSKKYSKRLVLKFEVGKSTEGERKSFLDNQDISDEFTAAKGTKGFRTSNNPFYIFIQNEFTQKYEFVSIRKRYGLFLEKSVGLSKDYNISPFTPEINTEIDNIIIAKALQNSLAARIEIGKNLTEARHLTKEEVDEINKQGICTEIVFLDSSWVLEVGSFTEELKDEIHVDKENYIELIKKRDGLLSLKVTNNKKFELINSGKEVAKLYYLTQPFTDTNSTPRARLYPSYKFPISTKVLVFGANSFGQEFSFTSQTDSNLNAEELLESATNSTISGRSINYASIYIYDQGLGKYLFVGAKRLDNRFVFDESINTGIDNMVIRKALGAP